MEQNILNTSRTRIRDRGIHSWKKRSAEGEKGNQEEKKGIRRNERACVSMYSREIKGRPSPSLKRRDHVNGKKDKRKRKLWREMAETGLRITHPTNCSALFVRHNRALQVLRLLGGG
jgi:hypothetical protein